MSHPSETPSTPPFSFTPGPTALHPRVAGEMAAAAGDGFLSESHRSARFRREVQRTTEALRALLGVPDDHRIVYLGSATEAMERLIQGAVRRRSGHLYSGAFGRRFRDVAVNLGREAVEHGLPDGHGFTGREPLPEGVELLALTQNETSTGVRVPAAGLHAMADRARESGALVAVDLVSGWPTEAVDPARIDAGFFSVQKGFGLPAGLGVMTVSPALAERAFALKEEGLPVGGYFHLPALVEAADRNQTVATPNMLAIRLLGTVTETYLEQGIETLRAEAAAKAARILEVASALEGVEPFVTDDLVRSETVLVFSVEGGSAPLLAALRQRGLVLGDGYGPWKGRQIRIANFPVQTPEKMETLARAFLTVENAGTAGAR